MDSVHIQDLAAQIAYNVAIYSGHISSNNLPESSHDVYPQAPISEFPDSVLAARQIALEAAHELHELLRGPEGIIMDAAQRVSGGYTMLASALLTDDCSRVQGSWYFISSRRTRSGSTLPGANRRRSSR